MQCLDHSIQVVSYSQHKTVHNYHVEQKSHVAKIVQSMKKQSKNCENTARGGSRLNANKRV